MVHELVESFSEDKTEGIRDESTDSLDSAIIGIDKGNETNVVSQQQESNPLRQRSKNAFKQSDPNAENDS